MADVDAHHFQEKQKKEERALKINEYQEQLKRQKEVSPNKFAKTGVAIVKS
jgi:hypothetical protein